MISFHKAAIALACILILIPAGLRAEFDTPHPCELLTESLVRAYFEISGDTEIVQDDNSTSRFPNCGYRWRIMSEFDEEAAKAANQAKMMDNIKARRSPNEGIDYNIKTHAQIRLTVAGFDNAEKAQSGLQGAKSFLIGRDEQRGKEPTAWEPVEGIGDKAYYHGLQLSFAWDDVLIHLNVTPKETAVALARVITE